MVSHPNRGWRGRWIVDPAACEASHGPSGLVVKFTAAADGGWSGEAVNLGEVFLALKDAGTKDIERVLARLIREAGDIYKERTSDTRS